MDQFLLRLLIGICIIWLTDLILGKVPMNALAKNAIFIVVLIVCLIFIVFGAVFTGFHLTH